jgi:hypothetical protein
LTRNVRNLPGRSDSTTGRLQLDPSASRGRCGQTSRRRGIRSTTRQTASGPRWPQKVCGTPHKVTKTTKSRTPQHRKPSLPSVENRMPFGSWLIRKCGPVFHHAAKALPGGRGGWCRSIRSRWRCRPASSPANPPNRRGSRSDGTGRVALPSKGLSCAPASSTVWSCESCLTARI